MVTKSSDSPRRGPRGDGEAVRKNVLEAAVSQFGAHGYQEATIRGIAKSAGVDARLVHYYFGSKEDLFSASIAEVFRSRGAASILLEEQATSLDAADSRGVRYIRTIVTALDDPDTGQFFVGLIRGLGTHEESRRIFLRFINEEIWGRVGEWLPEDQAATRISLAGSQMLGLIMARYVLREDPIASLDVEQLARIIGPTIDRYLSADLA